MEKKLRRILDRVSEILELVMAAIVFVAIVIAIFSLKGPFQEFLANHAVDGSFMEFMSYLLNIVIGIEFFKMLCKPGADTVLEVLMFVVARHMIVHDTSAVENLLTIIGIAIIFVIKKYLHTSWESNEEKGLFFGKKKKTKEDGDAAG